jgi:hypothetical protein
MNKPANGYKEGFIKSASHKSRFTSPRSGRVIVAQRFIAGLIAAQDEVREADG